MTPTWKALVLVNAGFTAVVAYWLHRSAEWLFYVGGGSSVRWGDSGLGHPMRWSIVLWGAIGVGIVFATYLKTAPKGPVEDDDELPKPRY